MSYKSQRRTTPDRVVDPGQTDSLVYNSAAGAYKQMQIGAHLKPFTPDGSTFSTNATTSVNLGQPGQMLAVYNNSGTLGSVTVSLLSVASLAAGVTDAAGNVGIACPPNAWTYISMADSIWVIASAATLLVYLIDDDTYLSPGTKT
jgi:hypothetical protein